METQKQKNIVKEVCNSVARRHSFDDIKNKGEKKK